MRTFKEFCDFYRGKTVLVSGHTGFKGTWLCQILKCFKANIVGYALEPPTHPSLFELTGMGEGMRSYLGDIRDLTALQDVFEKENPKIVFHMAAQPIVRQSYKDPVGTYSTNVMGTVNLLECCRRCQTVRSVVNVTTDKVYRNNEWEKGYVETDELDGYDPYSNSKSCSELVTHSYCRSFFDDMGLPVSTCRAGNVIGGGDFAKDRIIPDCVRAAEKGEPMIVRNPHSTRPYQHVLEPLFAYLMIAMEQDQNHRLAGNYNIGPDDNNCVTTGELAELFCRKWNAASGGESMYWESRPEGGPHEAGFLKLDCRKLKETFGWMPKWTMDDNIDRIVEFEKLRISAASDRNRKQRLVQCMERQVREYVGE